MKKASILCLLLTLLTTAFAQHLKFEGIPIDGTITNFQNKLATIGFNVDRIKSNNAPVGQRIFNGKFKGHNAEVTVYYGRKSKMVYKVEAVIESNKKEVIQGILDRSLDKIEKTYFYRSEHDVDDATDMHFRYYIYQPKTSEQSIGLIEVNPSHSYYLTGDKDKPLEFAYFIIMFTYEDRLNTDSTLPSDLEPHAEPGFTCREPENFGKYARWTLKYMQNECYERAICYLSWILDYYKYDCIPSNVYNYENGESEIDELILIMRGKCIGSIPTGVGMEKTNVYRIVDNETGLFNFIEFDAKYYGGLLYNHIKFDKYDISQLIVSLEKLKQNFEQKKAYVENLPTDKDWDEDIRVNLPAYVGKDNTSTGDYGDIEWTHTQLKAYFSYRNSVLSLEITVEDEFQFVFRFKHVEQIDDLIQFLNTVER